ncbi:CLUMA_CG013462, isoform A [Clunio marinus]|uniref:CLUMA_CG013462, isoform A n=1 Tax=Clunio marinus TaxID=568069 RepID=A0A1J1IKW2_9DIPT|nr:CLUMA_CG013462, isoform A [Clunio marinus]
MKRKVAACCKQQLSHTHLIPKHNGLSTHLKTFQQMSVKKDEIKDLRDLGALFSMLNIVHID